MCEASVVYYVQDYLHLQYFKSIKLMSICVMWIKWFSRTEIVTQTVANHTIIKCCIVADY